MNLTKNEREAEWESIPRVLEMMMGLFGYNSRPHE